MKILIADDEITTRKMLRAGLTQLDYQVVEATSGAEAWEVLQQQRAPEMAIVDWNMPGMTGIDLCRKLRQRKDAAYIYVILLTGNDSLNDLVAGMEAGADDYMTKPFKPAELNARLRAGQRIIDLQRELLAAQSQLEILASYDGLTGVWNRRMILARLGAELARGERQHDAVGVIMMDIDYFKRINDSFGHSVGDEALQQAAKRLTEVVRPYDSVGRFGGEEFLIVVPNCDRQGSYNLAERLRQALANAPILSARGPIAVTASFGVSATIAGEPLDPKVLVEAADRALYRAKELGRNRVEGLAAASGSAVELR